MMSTDAIGISVIIMLAAYGIIRTLEQLAKKASAERAGIVAALTRIAQKQDGHLRQMGEIYGAIKGPDSYLD